MNEAGKGSGIHTLLGTIRPQNNKGVKKAIDFSSLEWQGFLFLKLCHTPPSQVSILCNWERHGSGSSAAQGNCML